MRMRLKSHASDALVWPACRTRHRSNIVVAAMYRRCQISSSPPSTFPSGGLDIRCSCCIRWRYSILGSKFYFCLIHETSALTAAVDI